MKDTETPELNKIHSVREYSQKIGEFMEWLSSEKEIEFAQYHSVKELEDFESVDYGDLDDILMPIRTNKEKLLAEFFDIDLNKAEEERQDILNTIRAESEK